MKQSLVMKDTDDQPIQNRRHGKTSEGYIVKDNNKSLTYSQLASYLISCLHIYMCIYLVCVYLATQVVIVIEDRIHSCEYSCIMLILLFFHFCLHYIACRAAHVKHFSYFVRMYFTSADSISTSSSLDKLLLRKPISEK